MALRTGECLSEMRWMMQFLYVLQGHNGATAAVNALQTRCGRKSKWENCTKFS